VYIKTIPGRRMFVAANHTEFNAALNDFGGTKGVAYSVPWDMSTHNGKSYMSRAYDAVGRIFAGAQLDNKVGTSSALCSSHASSEPTPIQKACLYAMKDSKTPDTFISAMHAAIKHGALTRTAATVFTDHPVIAARYIPAAPRLMQVAPLRVKFEQVNPQVDPQVEVVDMDMDTAVADGAAEAVDHEMDIQPGGDALGTVDSLEPRQVHMAQRGGSGNALVPPQRKKGKKKR